MAISYVSYGWALVTEPTGSLWPPSGYQQGDLFILWGAHPTNSGWTHHFTSDPYQSYRWATSDEPVINFDSCSWHMVMVACYRGVDHVGDYDWGGGGNFCPVDINDYKATVVRWRWYFSTDPLYFSAPSGYIERAEYYSGGIYIYPFYYNSQIVDRSRGPGSDTGTWPEMAQTHNAIVLEPSALTATLQGVGSLSPIASYRASGGSTLTGVGSVSPQGHQIHGGRTTLQGAGVVSGEPFGVPYVDFTKYDFYVDDGTNHVGLLEYRDQALQPSTSLVALQPPRTDVGSNPIEMRPESGDLFGQEDFSGGAGQLYYHHEGRKVANYYWSEGFDISEPGKLPHLHPVAEAYDASSVGAVAVIKGLPFVAVGSKVRRGDGAFPGSWTEEDPQNSGTETVLDLIGAGDLGFAANGAGGIHKRDAAGSWADFSSFKASRLAWAKDRLIAASNIDGKIAEINMGTGTATDLETFPSGWTCEDIFEAGGFIYAVMKSSDLDQSRIHHYGLGTSALEKKGSTPFPQGQLMYAGAGYLDYAYIGGGKRNSSGGYDPILYQATIDSAGFLSYRKIAEEIGSGASSYPIKAIAPLGESVLFSWTLTSNSKGGQARDGIAVHHLGRDAFAHHLKKTAAAGANVGSIAVYKGRVLLSIDGDGLFYEDLSKYASTATLISSTADWGNAGEKAWDTINIAHKALPSGGSVAVQYAMSLPEGATWKDGLLSTTTDSTYKEGRLSKATSRHFCVKIISTAPAGEATAPTILSFGVRSNPAVSGNPEYTLTRYVRLLAIDRRNKQAPQIWQDVHAMREWLQGLAYEWVVVQEPGATWIARVSGVADVHPERPNFVATAGETSRDYYVVSLSLRGTR